VTLGTELTPAFLLQALGTAAGIVYAWAYARSRIEALEKRLADAELFAAAEKAAFSLYRETQARQLVSREILRDVETSIGNRFSGMESQLGYLRERLDDLHDRMLPGR